MMARISGTSLLRSVVLLLFSSHFCDMTAVEKDFQTFINVFGRQYKPSSIEYERRLRIFQANLKLQTELNNSQTSNQSAFYGVNKFSDMTQEEFKEQYLSSYTPNKYVAVQPVYDKLQSSTMHVNSLPLKVDWRDKKIVTPVKNQKSCGGCWAFSAVETIESMNALTSGTLSSLSVQEVIDCSFGFDNILYSCKGGDPCAALKWLEQTKAPLVPESVYPLTDKSEECKLLPNKTKGVHVKNSTCHKLVTQEELILQYLAYHGPVAVSVDATSWKNYLGGIIQYHCGTRVNNHAVQIVGYDISGEIPYYIVKNSWGSDFGNGGYLYVKYGENVCGIAQEVSKVDVFP